MGRCAPAVRTARQARTDGKAPRQIAPLGCIVASEQAGDAQRVPEAPLRPAVATSLQFHVTKGHINGRISEGGPPHALSVHEMSLFSNYALGRPYDASFLPYPSL